MADIGTLITRMREDGIIAGIAQRSTAQFGTRNQRLIGAELLPERPVDRNEYTEEAVEYRTVIANAGTRYGPVQLKEGAMVGEVLVVLRHSDLGNELTAREYDVLLRQLAQGSEMEAMNRIAGFLDRVNRGLIWINEKERWEMLLNRLVQRRGDNAYQEDVAFPTPDGHLLDADTPWDDPSIDPFDEIGAAAQVLRDKGYEPRRIITRSSVIALITGNPNTKTRTGRITISSGGGTPTLMGLGGNPTLEEVNRQLQADNLPPLEAYDARYRDQLGSHPFLQDGGMVIVGATDRQEEIAVGDEVQLLDGTLGYVGVGVPAGQLRPGRRLLSEHYESKPPRVENQGWQASFPVALEPEAWVSIRGIAATEEES